MLGRSERSGGWEDGDEQLHLGVVIFLGFFRLGREYGDLVGDWRRVDSSKGMMGSYKLTGIENRP